MKRLVFWSSLAICNTVIAYKLGGYFGTKIGECLTDIMVKK